jgi:ubiquitin-conjugating enzyme E2 I
MNERAMYSHFFRFNAQERKKWRKDHPIGFYARPLAKGDGSSDLFKWEAGIPGKKKTDWEGGLFKVVLHFSPDYPSKAPLVKFTPPIFHPNVYQDGEVCLSILTDEWAPGISVKAILVGVQDLLDTPNPRSPANGEANMYFTKSKAAYKNRVKAEALKYKPLEEF